MKSVLHSDSRRFHFSVIVPTRQRPAQLAQCLQALEALDYPRDAYEIIVVHDGEPARESGPSARGLSAGAVVFVNQPSGGPATARNTGANCATGTYLVFTDDDCAPAPDWLKRLERHFDTSPESAIGGLTVNALAAVPYSAASQFLVDYLYRVLPGGTNREAVLHHEQLRGSGARLPGIEGLRRELSVCRRRGSRVL